MWMILVTSMLNTIEKVFIKPETRHKFKQIKNKDKT
jgi:hypothetical protein